MPGPAQLPRLGSRGGIEPPQPRKSKAIFGETFVVRFPDRNRARANVLPTGCRFAEAREHAPRSTRLHSD